MRLNQDQRRLFNVYEYYVNAIYIYTANYIVKVFLVQMTKMLCLVSHIHVFVSFNVKYT